MKCFWCSQAPSHTTCCSALNSTLHTKQNNSAWPYCVQHTDITVSKAQHALNDAEEIQHGTMHCYFSPGYECWRV